MNKIPRQRMRELLESQQCFTCASVFDPLSARMAESIGFKVGILGGSVAALMTQGAPDIGLLTLSELAAQAKRVCGASDLPVIVDGDGGYGNALNVMKTIEELEYAGASMVTLEDTILPRRHKEAPLSLISIGEAKNKLKAALRARSDNSFAIFARTHALPSQSLDELLTRVKSYSDVGVDGITIFGLSDKDKLALISATTHLPIMVISYGDVDLGTPNELAMQKVRFRLGGHQAYEEAVRATYNSMLKLHDARNFVQSNDSGKDIIQRYSDSDKYNDLTNEFIFPVS